MRCPHTGKIMHAARADAKGVCKRLKQLYDEKKEPYLCEGDEGCGYWHVGNMPNWKRKGLPAPHERRV